MTNTIITRELAEKTLSLLPNATAHIAKFLLEQGVQGVPAKGDHCAIAEYLRKELPLGEHETIIAGYGSIVIGHIDENTFEKAVRLDTPPHIRTFMQIFDRGLFPSIIRSPQPEDY